MEGRMMQQRHAARGSESVTAGVSLVLGLVLVALGVIGFLATGFSGPVALNTDDSLLGLDLNIFHNIVHVAIGLGLIIAAQAKDSSVTQGVLVGVGLFLVVAALLGFIDYLQVLLSIDGPLAAANFVHLLVGAVALIFGLIGVRQMDEGTTRSGTDAASHRPRSLEERRALWDEEETYRERTY